MSRGLISDYLTLIFRDIYSQYLNLLMLYSLETAILSWHIKHNTFDPDTRHKIFRCQFFFERTTFCAHFSLLWHVNLDLTDCFITANNVHRLTEIRQNTPLPLMWDQHCSTLTQQTSVTVNATITQQTSVTVNATLTQQTSQTVNALTALMKSVG